MIRNRRIVFMGVDYMNKCPYCQSEMSKGSVVGDGRYNLESVPESVHMNPLCRTLSDENSCIKLSEFKWLKNMNHIEAARGWISISGSGT